MSFIGATYRSRGKGLLTGREMAQSQLNDQNPTPNMPWFTKAGDPGSSLNPLQAAGLPEE